MIERDEAATAALADWCETTLRDAETDYVAARAIARRLGARKAGDLCEVGFWLPALRQDGVADADVFVDLLTSDPGLTLTEVRQTRRFSRRRLPVVRVGDYCFVAVRGMVPGTRERVGTFYRLTWRGGDGGWRTFLDPMAASVPFGVFAPAEYYDFEVMQAGRGDASYYASLNTGDVHKFGPPVNILQVHVPTATEEGTLASLTRRYTRLAERIRSGAELTPDEKLFLGYDAVQLLPVEPTTVYETGLDFWTETEVDDDTVEVALARPDTTNWGYDVVLAGMGTVNPTLLESGRPDELADFAAVLHSHPTKPKMLILDVVFGHSDNQGLKVLNPEFFAGANMYGQNVNYRHPQVRAMLLEMQRRKVNIGADGVRVDGAQDFKWWDADAQVLHHDDEYLQEMADIEQEVAGLTYRPWFIFEDGRPWPEEDWELSSTYRAVIENQRDDDVFQWGPLTFAHNTPFLYGFWLSKWWRIREILDRGANWISGCANHDTLRRGTQVSPKLNINTRLGNTRMEILDKAYDNPAIQLLTYAAFPGVPMDFLNASARGSWGFIRNQDDRYGVKVVAEEVISIRWQVDEAHYDKPDAFRRLKALGFTDREELLRFMTVLPSLVEVTDYDLDVMAKLLDEVEPPLAGPRPVTVAELKGIARAWMDDMHDFCNVTNYFDALDPAQFTFNLALRNFRRARSWLRQNLGPRDHFDYRHPVKGTVLISCLRHGPDGEQVYSVLHMEGGPVDDFDPLRLPVPGLEGGGWQVALRTPPIGSDYLSGPLTLHDSMGVTFVRPYDAGP